MNINSKNNNNTFPNNKNSFSTLNANEDERYAFKNLPQGLLFGFTQNAAAMTAFENMDNDKKMMIIDMAGKVKSKKEMHELVENIAINNL